MSTLLGSDSDGGGGDSPGESGNVFTSKLGAERGSQERDWWGWRMRGRHSRPPRMERKEGGGQQRRMLRAVKDLENGEGDI